MPKKLASSRANARPKRPKSFRLLDLPAEIRIRIYEIVLRVDHTVDLWVGNHRHVAPRLNILYANRQLYEEAYRVFYRVNAFRIFSCDGKFIQTKKPLFSRFPSLYRSEITTIELRLGPGWTKPPKAWGVRDSYGLSDCKSMRLLKIFVELDPEDSAICREWMERGTSYLDYCTDHLVDILSAVPSITEVSFDGYPSVRKNGPMITALRDICLSINLKISYGPMQNWEHQEGVQLETDINSAPGMAIMIHRLEALMLDPNTF